MRIQIPQFMVTLNPDATEEAAADFIVVDVPWENGTTRHGILLFSTIDKAREFISENSIPDAQVRFLDYRTLHLWLTNPLNREADFDCAIVDFMNNGNPWITHGFDTRLAVTAINSADHEADSIPVESWTVFV